MPAGSSTSCTRTTAVRSPARRWSTSARCTTVERKAKDLGLDADGRKALRQADAVPVAKKLQAWLTKRLAEVAPRSATEKAIKYSLGRWVPLTRYLDDGELPIDNNWLENRIRPVALGRSTGCSPAPIVPVADRPSS